MKSCEGVLELLDLHAAGELGGDETNRVSVHLQECTECAAEFKQRQNFMAVVNRGFREMEPDTGFERQLVDRHGTVPRRSRGTRGATQKRSEV